MKYAGHFLKTWFWPWFDHEVKLHRSFYNPWSDDFNWVRPLYCESFCLSPYTLWSSHSPANSCFLNSTVAWEWPRSPTTLNFLGFNKPNNHGRGFYSSIPFSSYFCTMHCWRHKMALRAYREVYVGVSKLQCNNSYWTVSLVSAQHAWATPWVSQGCATWICTQLSENWSDRSTSLNRHLKGG